MLVGQVVYNTDMVVDNSNKLDKTKCDIKTCTFNDICHIFEEFHYKKAHMGGGITTCFAMFIDDKLVGGSVLGKPRHEKKYNNCIDIRRMACIDSAPCNSESWFLSQIIKWITANTEYEGVLSYSDTTVGHKGTIYKASNFKQMGETTPTKYVEWKGKIYHPRSLSIERPYSHELRECVKTGEAVVKTGLPKIIWMYNIVRKKHSKKKMVLEVYDKNIIINPNASQFFNL